MADFTLLEVHLHDSTVTANAPFSGEATVHDDEESEERNDDDEDDESGGGLPLKPILALALVAVAAVAARKFLAGDALDDQISEVDIE